MTSNTEMNSSQSSDKSFHWIHVQTEDEEKLKNVQSQFDLPDYVMQSARDQREISRMEYWEQDNRTIPNLVILKYPVKVEGQLGCEEYVTYPIVIITFKKTIITIAQTDVPFLTDTQQKHYLELKTVDRDYFILSLIWNIGTEYMECLKEVDQRMKELEQQLQDSTDTEQLYGLMALQKSLVYFESAIESNHPIIKKLETIEKFTETARSRLLLHRALIEIEQAEKTVDETNRLLDQIGEVYSAAIGNNLNTVMKFLSSITIILSVPGIIGALWGMNVPVPLTTDPEGFIILTAITMLICLLGAWFFYKKKYL